jgi:hypothetical protein
MIQAAKPFAMRKPGPTMSGLGLINIISVVASSDPTLVATSPSCLVASAPLMSPVSAGSGSPCIATLRAWIAIEV